LGFRRLSFGLTLITPAYIHASASSIVNLENPLYTLVSQSAVENEVATSPSGIPRAGNVRSPPIHPKHVRPIDGLL